LGFCQEAKTASKLFLLLLRDGTMMYFQHGRRRIWNEGVLNEQQQQRLRCCAANYLQLLKSDYPQLNKEKSVGLFKI